MRYDLAALTRRARNPRVSQIVLRDIAPPSMFAADLFRACYRPIIGGWTAAVPRIIAEYDRSLPVRDALITDSIADLGALLESLGEELTRLVLELVPELRDWTVRYEQHHRARWRGAVLTATGVDLETILIASGVPTSLADTIAWNVALMKDVSSQAQQRITAAVFAGFRDRRPAREVAAQIREAIAMGRRRSINIASDQLVKLSSALDRERRADAGITSFKWRWSHKRHGRKEHMARDGKIYSEATAPEDRAGTLPFCGCREQAVLVLD
jgi:hypothetical protein